jgi:hypothetical protein
MIHDLHRVIRPIVEGVSTTRVIMKAMAPAEG